MRKKSENRRRALSFLRGKAGMSMVTVLVAFVILLMLVALFTRVTTLCQNMVTAADQIRSDTAELMSEYYTNDTNLQSDVLMLDKSVRVTDGASSFTMDTSVYAYTNGSASVYSFGRHTVTMAGG